MPSSPSGRAVLLLAIALVGCSTRKNQSTRDAAGEAPAGAAGGSTPVAAAPSPVVVAAPRSSAEAGLYYAGAVTLTAEVVANVRAIAARDPAKKNELFVRVGDSLSSGGPDNPFACFARASGARVDLGGRDELQATVDFFDQVKLGPGRPPSRGTAPASSTAWDRSSYAAVVAAGSSFPLRLIDDPPFNGARPLQKELDEVPARFAVWLLGTNDTCSTPNVYRNGALYRDYSNNLMKNLEYLSARGVVPVLTYIPPVLGCSDTARFESADTVALQRAIAVARKVPTIDAYTEVAALGMPAFDDGLHLATSKKGGCVLTPEGLQKGVNVRNLRTLEVLDKLRRVVTSQVDRIDPDPPKLYGRGTPAEPFDVPGLPFGHGARLDEGGGSKLADYTACGGEAGRDGREAVYRMTVNRRTPVRVIAVGGECASATSCLDDIEVTAAIFKDSLDLKNCLSAGTTLAKATLEPGTYLLVMDSARGRSQPKTGVLAVHECLPGDPRCTAGAPKP